MKVKYSKLKHTDVITIDKLKYVKEEALFTGVHADTNKVISKHLYFIQKDLCIGEYSLNQDKICLFNNGLEYFTKKNKRTLDKQIAKTISHEIMHRVLFYNQGELESYMFDNIAESLKEYGVW